MKLGDVMGHGINNIMEFSGTETKEQFRQFFIVVLFLFSIVGTLSFGQSFYEKYKLLEYSGNISAYGAFPDYQTESAHRESTVIEGVKFGFVSVIIPFIITLSSYVRRLRDTGLPGKIAFLLPFLLYLFPLYFLSVAGLSFAPKGSLSRLNPFK